MEKQTTAQMTGPQAPVGPARLFGMRAGDGVPFAALYMTRMKKKTALGLR